MVHRLVELFSSCETFVANSVDSQVESDPILTHVTIIEARVMAGDLVCYALRQALPSLRIDLVSSIDNVRSEPCVLVYSFVNRGCDLPAMERALARLLERLGTHPLVCVTETMSEQVATLMGRYGVAKWISASAGFNALVSAVRGAASVGHAEALPLAEGHSSKPLPARELPLGLTRKEHDILRFLHEGRSNKIIAHRLGCSESTVKAHISNMMRKLRLHNRTQLALVFQNKGTADLPNGTH